MSGVTGYTGTIGATNLVHFEEGLTFVWPGGHVPILVRYGDLDFGQISMSKEDDEYTLDNGTGTLEEHMHLFRLLCGMFVADHIDCIKDLQCRNTGSGGTSFRSFITRLEMLWKAKMKWFRR